MEPTGKRRQVGRGTSRKERYDYGKRLRQGPAHRAYPGFESSDRIRSMFSFAPHTLDTDAGNQSRAVVTAFHIKAG